MNKLEDRLVRAGQESREAVDRMPPMQPPVARRLPSAAGLAVGAAVVLLLVAIPMWLGLGSGSDEAPVAATTIPDSVSGETVFMLPEFMLEGFRLYRASMIDVQQRTTNDPGQAAGMLLEFLPRGQAGRTPEQPWFQIRVMDRLAEMSALLGQDDPRCVDDDGTEVECRLEEALQSACTGEAAIAEDRMDPEACMDETERLDSGLFGGTDVEFERIAIRGLPAHVIRVEGSDFDTAITTYEGGPVLSEVVGHGVAEAELRRVAEGLQPVGVDDFLAATDSGVGVAPEAFFQECMADSGFEVENVEIGRNLERYGFPQDYLDDPDFEEVRSRCEASLYEEYGIPVHP